MLVIPTNGRNLHLVFDRPICPGAFRYNLLTKIIHRKFKELP